MAGADQVCADIRVDTVEALAARVSESSKNDRTLNERTLVAVAGAPGSGKSTISELLQAELESAQQLTAQIVPMDGFHYDNAILLERGLLSCKGAPDTFDAAGLKSLLTRLTSRPLVDVAVPVFDRESDLSRASARNIRCSSQVIIVEGNYLLLDTEPWSSLKSYFDTSVIIQTEKSILHQRLMHRWLSLDFNEQDARLKVDENDMPNAMTVMSHSVQPDLVFINNTINDTH